MYLNVNMTQPQPQPQPQQQQQHVSNMTQQQQQQQQQQGSTTLLSVIACAAGGPANGELTPRTPEIVNSLIAMTNPFDSGFGNSAAANSRSSSAGAGATARDLGNGHGELFAGRTRARADSTSSGEQTSPPSIQHTCSQLIKEGLKLTLQTKRRVSGMSAEDSKKQRTKRPGPGSAGGRPREDNSADDEEDDEFSNTKAMHGQLTPEDEERRRRRRERNKIAATKCRLKKREKTVILVQESESLESQNHELKSQIQELETQRRRLVDMLNLHGPTCLKSEPGVVPPASAAATDGPYHQQQHQHQHHHQHQQQQQQQQYGQDPLPSCFQENYIPADLNPADGSPDLMPTTAGDPDFPPVKLEGFPVGQDYFRAAPPGPTSAGTV